MFFMANDGTLSSAISDIPKLYREAAILRQRLYLFNLLSNGIAVSLLQGAEFRDSKVSRLFLLV
jgi:ATP-dependent RNA helicase DDX60